MTAGVTVQGRIGDAGSRAAGHAADKVEHGNDIHGHRLAPATISMHGSESAEPSQGEAIISM
jgi:hypothetical protein